MIVTIQVAKQVEVKTLHVSAGVRYWEDGTVNGLEDTEGILIPCRNGDRWEPIINIDTGIIENWPIHLATANVHYKVCDDGNYCIKDSDGGIVIQREGYVPSFFPGDHFGDYLILQIDKDGKIDNWPPPEEIQEWLNGAGEEQNHED